MKIKRLLASLSVLALVSSSTATVSCSSTSIKDVNKRKVDDETLNLMFQYAIKSFNPQQFASTSDQIALSNIYDTLLTNGKYDGEAKNEDYGPVNSKTGTIISQLAELQPKNETTNNLSTTFTLKMNQNAKWYKKGGQAVRNIKTDDLINTAKFMLNPLSTTEQIYSWTFFINGAEWVNEQLSNAISDNPSLLSTDIYKGNVLKGENRSIWDEFISHDINDLNNPEKPHIGMIINGDEIIFKLFKAAPYFVSQLTMFSFSPMPEEILGYNSPMDYGKDVDNVLTSGPYYIDKYRVGYQFSLKRNDDWYGESTGKIKNINYNFTQRPDPATTRLLFETGDYSEAPLQPSDTYGWGKYVGKDINSPKFDGIQKVNNNQVGTQILLFNYANTNAKNGKESNTALSLLSVRAWIEYAMNRSTFIKYFSGPYDEGKTSSFLQNTYNPSGYLNATEDNKTKDYVDLMKEQMENPTDISLGADSFYQNYDLIKSSIKTKEAQAFFEQKQYEKAIISQVKSDLAANGINNKVDLTFLTNGANNSSWNPYIQKMVDDFSAIDNNPISIKTLATTDASDNSQKLLSGDFSMSTITWSGNFVDPFAFLSSVELKGDMEAYFGLSRLVKDMRRDDQGIIASDSVKLNNTYKTSASKDLIDKMVEFTNDVTKADSTVDDSSKIKETGFINRYKAFAKAEDNLLFKNKLIMPLSIPNGPTNTYLSYIDKSTTTNVYFGDSQYRFENVKMFKSLSELSQGKSEKQQDILNNKEN